MACSGMLHTCSRKPNQPTTVFEPFEGGTQPLKKIDIVAVDINMGAIENWALMRTMNWEALYTPWDS